jgi:Homeobox KN domain
MYLVSLQCGFCYFWSSLVTGTEQLNICPFFQSIDLKDFVCDIPIFETPHTKMAEARRRSSGASGFESGSCCGSGSSSNVSTPRAAYRSASTFESEADSTMVALLDEAAMLECAALETPLIPWPSISAESTVITGLSTRLSPLAISSRSEPDGRRTLFLSARRSSEPTSTARFAETSSPLNVDSSQRADNGKRNTSGNRTRRLGLRAWCIAHWDHPYPDADEKDELCNEYSMSRKQLDIW